MKFTKISDSAFTVEGIDELVKEYGLENNSYKKKISII